MKQEKITRCGALALPAIIIASIALTTQTVSAEEFSLEHDQVSVALPGERVINAPPNGWSNIVIKSCPRANQGDIEGLSKRDKSLTSVFRTITLADVQPRTVNGTKQFQLTKLALGVCVPVKGKGDTMVCPDTYKKYGAQIGLFGPVVLNKIFSEFDGVHFVARSDTAAVYDSPVVMHYNGKNREMMIRYVLIAHQSTGRLDAMGWVIELDSKGKYQGVASKVQWLPENHITACSLHVDSNEYSFGVPSKKAFGVVGMPQGKVQFSMPKHLAKVAAKPEFSDEDAETLVSSLRKVVAFYDKKNAQKK